VRRPARPEPAPAGDLAVHPPRLDGPPAGALARLGGLALGVEQQQVRGAHMEPRQPGDQPPQERVRAARVDHHRPRRAHGGHDPGVVAEVEEARRPGAAGAQVVGVDHDGGRAVHRTTDQRRLAGSRHPRHHDHGRRFKAHERSVSDEPGRSLRPA